MGASVPPQSSSAKQEIMRMGSKEHFQPGLRLKDAGFRYKGSGFRRFPRTDTKFAAKCVVLDLQDRMF